MRVRNEAVAAAVGVLLIAACGGDSSSDATSATPVVATTVATTTVQIATTIAATTTAQSTTTAPENFILTLRSDGIGPWDFGTPYEEVIDGLVAEFGEAQPIDTFEYVPHQEGSGLFVDPTQGGVYFAYPSIRRACWNQNTLCLYFGGASQDAVALTGWRNTSWMGNDLWVWTEEGIMVGSQLSEVPAITGIAFICEDHSGARAQFGKAQYDGMSLALHSELYGFDQTPPPGDPTIIRIEAGELIIAPEDLCRSI